MDVNLGKEDTAVNLVWLPGNRCLTLAVGKFVLSVLFRFKVGDLGDSESFDFTGCL